MTGEQILLVIQVIIAAITTAGIAVPAFYKMRSERKKEEATTRKEDANAAHSITESALSMVKQYGDRIDTLEEQVKKLEKSLRYWQKGCALLIRQLVDHDIVPCFDPNGGPEDSG